MPNLASPISWKPLALPNEHGGWGFLLEPAVLGLIVAPSAAGWLFGFGAVAAFLVRHPLRLAAADALRKRMYPRTRACILLSIGYGTIALACLGAGALLAPRAALALAAGAAAATIQFAYDARNRGRELVAEIAGAVAGSTIVTAITIAGGASVRQSLVLTVLVLARSIPSIVFVRAALRNAGRAPTVVLHLAAAGAAVASWRLGLAPAASIMATGLLLLRAVMTRRGTPARIIGIRELIYGTIFVLLTGTGWQVERG